MASLQKKQKPDSDNVQERINCDRVSLSKTEKRIIRPKKHNQIRQIILYTTIFLSRRDARNQSKRADDYELS